IGRTRGRSSWSRDARGAPRARGASPARGRGRRRRRAVAHLRRAGRACGRRGRGVPSTRRRPGGPRAAGAAREHPPGRGRERARAVATIWSDRQPKMNTMTVAMRNEFPGIFAALEADETIRVVVIRGAGGKAFSAGGDVAEFLTLAPADLELWGDTLTAAERCRKPVVAAIDGYTMGAGLELAVACDFRIATLRSEFAFPEVRLGMIPGSGGTQ